MPPAEAPADRHHPVIGFLTDFGLDGAAAICRGVMLSIARDAQIIDICHTVEKYSVRDGAYLLATALPWLPVGVHVAVVDPGVGTDRRAVGLLTGRGDVLIGPDNGLLTPAARRLGGVTEARLLHNPQWLLSVTSATFHGRDIFAPVAAHLARGEPFESVGPTIELEGVVHLPQPVPTVEDGVLWTGVTYVDSFGNLRLGGGLRELADAVGAPELGMRLELLLPDSVDPRDEHARWQRTFGEASPGELLAYQDSSGNLALAESRGSAAARLGLASGARIGIRRA
jgi:S-adenosylmethionine hydrolase